MKMNEIKGLETKELAEKLETAVANYDQLKLNGNKKFKKDKTGCRYQ